MQNYSLIEKLAIVRSLDEIISADEIRDPSEIKMLEKIMHKMELNTSFVDEARRLKFSESMDVLKRMPLKRKKLFAELMHKVAIADGYADENETNLIIDIYKKANIDVETPDYTEFNLDLSFIYFESVGYYNYPEGEKGNREFIEEPRLIKIEPVINTTDEYALMIFNNSDNNSLWGHEIAFKPMHIKLAENQDRKVKFSSNRFKGTELQLYHNGPEIEKVSMETVLPFRYVEYVG